jgi:hypothetical protein
MLNFEKDYKYEELMIQDSIFFIYKNHYVF